MVMRLPERDQLSLTRQKMLADLCVAFGGRIAEELIFGHDKVTTGAISDIEQATRMARAMVTRFGMSDELGPIAYAENQEEVFLGHSVSRTQNISEATAQKIDSEIRRIIDDCYRRAYQISSPTTERRSGYAGARASGIRDPDGRRDRRPAQGHPAGAHALRRAGAAARGPGTERAVPRARRARSAGIIAPEPQPGR